MTYTMARPNKLMDAAALEEFTKTEHPITFEEWELEYSHLLDLWDYLEIECDTALTEFEAWYNQRDQ